ncbi:MAG: hypothetical protein LBU65_13105 [Planctomycetaceae bacterium]|jgi:hypothetical protein|nr:hypothetical protein [Planctomycetaceae bacterium]
MRNIDKKLYKFALYGLSGSGKTCTLTAMSMGGKRRPTETGEVCGAYIDEFGSDQMREWAKELAAYERGLEHGDLPNPTPPDADNPPRYRFTLSSKTQGEFYVEIIDYAGELINPDLLNNNNNEFTKKIREKMRNLDGILVLAITPEKGERTSEIPNEIGKLQTAFSSLIGTMEGERQCPVALILTKWDRYSDIPVNALAAEQNNVTQFFADNQMYWGLRQALESSIGKEHFAVFPMSGLGKCVNGKPVKVNPLQSFGVPFPFCWLAEQINTMEVERLEKLELPNQWIPLITSQRLPRWMRKWNKTDDVKNLSETLINRLPKKETEKVDKIKKVRKKVFWNVCIRTSMFCVMLWGIITGFHTFQDLSRFRAAHTAINKSQTSPDELLGWQKYLESYRNESYFPFLHLHWFWWRSQALTYIETIKQKTDDDAFMTIRDTANSADKVKLGEQYEKDYPNGRHKSEVNKIVTSAKAELYLQENEAALVKLDTLYANAKKTEKESDFNILISEGDKNTFFPYPDYATGEQRQKRHSIIQEARLALNVIILTKNWEDFEKDVNASFNVGNLKSAFEALTGWKKRDDKWQTLCKDIINRTDEKVNDMIKNYGTSYERTVSMVKEIVEAGQKLSNVDVNNGADTLLQSLNRKIEELNYKWDKSFYDKVKNDRTETVCNNYLNSAPLGTMRGEVQQYKKYLQDNRDAQQDYERRKKEFLDNYKGKGRVPALPTGADYWEDYKNGGYLWTSKQYLYKHGQFLPVETVIHAEDKKGIDKGNPHTILQITEKDITEVDVPRNMPTEPSLPEWRK